MADRGDLKYVEEEIDDYVLVECTPTFLVEGYYRGYGI